MQYQLLSLLIAAQVTSALAVPVFEHLHARQAELDVPRKLALGHLDAVLPLNERAFKLKQKRALRAPSRTQAAVAASVANACPAPAALAQVAAASGEAAAGDAAAAAEAAAAEAAAAEVAAAAAAAQEIELQAAFGEIVQLDFGGNDVITNVFYPPAVEGFFEVEAQNPDPRILRVTQNQAPAAPPAGFVAVDPSSFIVELAGGNDLTLAKIDYFFDVTNPAIAALDLATTQVGKLSADGCSFVIDPALGELEFEAEENELTLTVADLNGEWGIFIPAAAEAAAVATQTAAAAAAVLETAAAAATQAAAEDAAVAAAAAAAAAEEEVVINGAFDTAIPVEGGNIQQGLLFPGGASGEFEVEFTGAAANVITVSTAPAPVEPPTGFLFVDPNTFTVSTDAATAATDVLKIDYFYSDAVEAAVDVNQAVIGKLDAATGTFVTEGLGEFEIELEEKEWTLTVADLNGEWAMLIPATAVVAAAARRG